MSEEPQIIGALGAALFAKERTTNFPFPVYWKIPSVFKMQAVRMGKILPTLGGQIMIKAVKKA